MKFPVGTLIKIIYDNRIAVVIGHMTPSSIQWMHHKVYYPQYNFAENLFLPYHPSEILWQPK